MNPACLDSRRQLHQMSVVMEQPRGVSAPVGIAASVISYYPFKAVTYTYERVSLRVICGSYSYSLVLIT